MTYSATTVYAVSWIVVVNFISRVSTAAWKTSIWNKVELQKVQNLINKKWNKPSTKILT